MATLGFILSRGFLFPLKDIILFYVMVLSCFGFGFSINDCFDTEEDNLDKDKKNPVAIKKIGFKGSLIFSVSLAILGLALSLIFGLKVFLLCLVAILLTFFYSAPPLRMKSRPLLDLLSHGFFAGVFIFLTPLLIFTKDLTLFHYLFAFSIFYFSVMLELRNHIEDYETDKKAGLRTTVCVLGYEKSERLLRYLAVLYPLTILSLYLLTYQRYFVLFLVFTAIFLFIFLFKKDSKIVRNYKVLDAYATLSFVLLLIENNISW